MSRRDNSSLAQTAGLVAATASQRADQVECVSGRSPLAEGSPDLSAGDQAKDVLRSIAGDEALEQAVMHLQQLWAKRSAS